jgi:transposase
MRRTETVRLDPTCRSEAELRLLGDRVSRLWNSANYLCRQAFLAKQGVPLGAALERRINLTPEYRQLPSDIAQEVAKKLSEAWKSYFELRAMWSAGRLKDKPGLPQYRKNRKTDERPFDLIPIKHPRSYAIDAKDAHIVLPRDRRRTSGRGRLQIAYRGRKRFDGKMGRCELTWDLVRKRWYMAWAVDVAAPRPIAGERIAAIDLGVRIIASLSIEGLAQALHFEGREALKDFDWLGREIAREQSCIANSRGKAREDRSPTSRNIARLHQLRRLRTEHALRSIGKEIAAVCFQHSVSTVYLGYPKGILRDVRYGSSTWASRIHNFWSFDQALSILECALQSVGIVPVRVSERGSSSRCPTCQSPEVVRNPRYRLRCKVCGESIHSDQAGSRNIAQQSKPSVRWAGLEASPRTETRRWNKHQWDFRSSNPKPLSNAREFQATH